jgi:hypothetical protein
MVAREIAVEPTPRGQHARDRSRIQTFAVPLCNEATYVVHLQLVQRGGSCASNQRLYIAGVVFQRVAAESPFMLEMIEIPPQELTCGCWRLPSGA